MIKTVKLLKIINHFNDWISVLASFLLFRSSKIIGWQEHESLTSSTQAWPLTAIIPVSSSVLPSSRIALFSTSSSTLGFCKRLSTRLTEKFLVVIPLWDATITPWLEAISSVIGTVMMQDVSSGSTMVEASKQGRTSPVIINRPPAKVKNFPLVNTHDTASDDSCDSKQHSEHVRNVLIW